MNISSRQKISKDTIELYNIVNPLDIMDINRVLHPTTAEHTFFSSSLGIVNKIEYILGHKAQLNKFRTEFICSLLLEIN